jgi:pilus assembly protein CpaC
VYISRYLSHFARAAVAAALSVLLTAASLAAAGAAAAGAVATLESVVVEPDESGVRIAVAVRGAFHYRITRRGDGLEIVLDPVSAAAADHTLAIGPVRSIRVRSIAGVPPRAAITVITSGPVDAADSYLDGGTLAVRVIGRARPAAAHPAAATRASAEAAPELPRGPQGKPASEPAAPPAGAPPQDRRTVPASDAAHIAGTPGVPRALTLDEGAGQLLETTGLIRVAVSEPRVIGAVPVSGSEVLLMARAPGRATVYVWAEGGLSVYAVEVRAAEDPFGDLRRALAALLPDAAITVTEVHGTPSGPVMPSRPVRPVAAAPGVSPSSSLAVPPASDEATPVPPPSISGRGAVLSGSVETQMDKAKAEEIARAFVSGVVNLLTVRRPVQFSLQVDVVELTRTAQDALGINWGGGQVSPGAPPSLNGGIYNFQVLTSPGLPATGLDVLIAQLQALSQRGQARLLARPGLVVLAGRTASLLLGGQVPVPVAGENGSVTVEYKDFGVILTARPEYERDGRVFLQITPEVSTLDFTDAIKVAGFTIPALRVRRAQTIVAMRPGETLVLGGLLQRDDVELVQKIPLLGDLPIIGALFRSRSFQRQESDLLILVTPQIVEVPPTP